MKIARRRLSKSGMGSKQNYLSKILRIQPSALIALWSFDDASGALCRNVSPVLTSSAIEHLQNTGFEFAGSGGADVYSIWIENVGTGSLADDTTFVNAGSHAVKLTAGSSANTYVTQYIMGTPGQTVTFSFYTRGDGTNAGRYMLVNVFSGAILKAIASTNVTGTTYTKVEFSYTVPAGVVGIYLRLYCPAANGGIAYFDDVSAVSVGSCHGLYPASGITYGQAGMGVNGSPYSVALSGVTSGITIGGGPLNNLWNGDKGSAIAWGKIDAAATWSDLSIMRYLYHVKCSDNQTFYVTFGKDLDAANRISWFRRAGIGYVKRIYDFSSGPLGWFCMGYSWDYAGNSEKCYLYVPGSLPWTKTFDGTISSAAAITPHPVFDQNAVLGGGNTNSQLWKGNQDVTASWSGVCLTDGEMRRAMVA